ncbi:scavenger receptor cysteine-rich type 1 protein M130-like [Branchiostoma lanceolatum]|uniref:scavenger receptor cysteine-rich type 1 protein M130-like n=1 Tax=Branchiostoma lanceolatum TaxID=7740 RepID=UPI003451B4AE
MCEGPLSQTVSCNSSDIRIRLVGGLTANEGRLEVRTFGSAGWGTVCDDRFDINNAIVACRMLGYSEATEVRPSAHYEQGSGDIYMDDLECTGNESSLCGCPYAGWGVENCTHSQDVGVVCGSPVTPGTQWLKIFATVKGAGQKAVDAWSAGAGINVLHDKSYLVEQWGSLGIKRVKIVLEAPSGDVNLIFNGENTDKYSWFSLPRLLSSPWNDINTEPINYFSIAGDTNNQR